MSVSNTKPRVGNSIFRSFWSLKKIDRDRIDLVNFEKCWLWWNLSFDHNKRSIHSKKMHFSFVFDSFPPFYAKRPNRSRRSLIFFKDRRDRFAPIGLWKMSIWSFSKLNRSQKTIDSIENPMIEFPTLPKPDLSWKTRF